MILTHGVVKSATLLIPPMAFNIENIGKNFFCSFFSKYVIFKFHHFLSKVAPLGDVDNSKKKSDTTPLKMGLNDEKRF